MWLSPGPAGWYTSFLLDCFRFWIFSRWVHAACLLSVWDWSWFFLIHIVEFWRNHYWMTPMDLRVQLIAPDCYEDFVGGRCKAHPFWEVEEKIVFPLGLFLCRQCSLWLGQAAPPSSPEPRPRISCIYLKTHACVSEQMTSAEQCQRGEILLIQSLIDQFSHKSWQSVLKIVVYASL